MPLYREKGRPLIDLHSSRKSVGFKGRIIQKDISKVYKQNLTFDYSSVYPLGCFVADTRSTIIAHKQSIRLVKEAKTPMIPVWHGKCIDEIVEMTCLLMGMGIPLLRPENDFQALFLLE
jgi:hypothetical protein